MSSSLKHNTPENILKIRKYFGNNLKKSDNKSLLKKSISQRFEQYLFNDYLTMIIQNNEHMSGWEK